LTYVSPKWYASICHILTYVNSETIVAEDLSSGKQSWMNGRMKNQGNVHHEEFMFLDSLPGLEDAQKMNTNGTISPMMRPIGSLEGFTSFLDT